MAEIVALPQSFLEMPRWWHEGADWLASLPALTADRCTQWGLRIDGDVMHGSNAIAVPVTRDGESLVLKMTYPDDDVADQVRALKFWGGRGTVLLVEADPDAGALLMERLDHERSLTQLPLATAVPVIAQVMRRLAVPAPGDAPDTGTLAAGRADSLREDWLRLGQPFERRVLHTATGMAGDILALPASMRAVNGDLHYEQVLTGLREPWLVVDPVLLAGDIDYSLGSLLWTRTDEMADGADIRHHLDTIVSEAGLDAERAHAWALFRSVDYWLWGLNHQLTYDPERCRRIVEALI